MKDGDAAMNKSPHPAEGGARRAESLAVLSRILGSDNARFLREFVRDPVHTAAIAPSSPALAEAMVAAVPSAGPRRRRGGPVLVAQTHPP